MKLWLLSTEALSGTNQGRVEGAMVIVIVWCFTRCSGAAMEKPSSSGRAALEEGRSLVEVGGLWNWGKKRVDASNILNILFNISALVAAAFAAF